MSDFLLQFIDHHPWFTLLIILLQYGLIRRMIRHWDIKKHGRPSFHIDADGDAIESNNKDWRVRCRRWTMSSELYKKHNR